MIVMALTAAAATVLAAALISGPANSFVHLAEAAFSTTLSATGW